MDRQYMVDTEFLDFPFTMMGPLSSARANSLMRFHVYSLMHSVPRSDEVSIRLARFTASPMTV